MSLRVKKRRWCRNCHEETWHDLLRAERVHVKKRVPILGWTFHVPVKVGRYACGICRCEILEDGKTWI